MCDKTMGRMLKTRQSKLTKINDNREMKSAECCNKNDWLERKKSCGFMWMLLRQVKTVTYIHTIELDSDGETTVQCMIKNADSFDN
jgi:hypothetical protein